ncbi:hypothetical protein M378DRAFT_919096 [Amanita muscaria Koide BX008]|uniref:Uncharacterized protein n=1 Tax=Amanita muscaria (strain Koide BX008) TaxID=946122 RepID=A0A0C2WVZ9_AMAMK|nr:hypothetical protein M378DRAFT_919096 [Amanita muscaria Koide BX008]
MLNIVQRPAEPHHQGCGLVITTSPEPGAMRTVQSVLFFLLFFCILRSGEPRLIRSHSSWKPEYWLLVVQQSIIVIVIWTLHAEIRTFCFRSLILTSFLLAFRDSTEKGTNHIRNKPVLVGQQK